MRDHYKKLQQIKVQSCGTNPFCLLPCLLPHRARESQAPNWETGCAPSKIILNKIYPLKYQYTKNLIFLIIKNLQYRNGLHITFHLTCVGLSRKKEFSEIAWELWHIRWWNSYLYIRDEESYETVLSPISQNSISNLITSVELDGIYSLFFSLFLYCKHSLRNLYYFLNLIYILKAKI